MSSLRIFLVLAAVLAAGCASTPPEMTASADAPAAPVVAVDIEPVVVTLEEISVDPDTIITCRQMLKQGSNVIITTCLTGADWKRYKRREAEEAAAFVRTLQGGAFR